MGASLLAMREGQPASLSADPPLSRAGSLPHLFWVMATIACTDMSIADNPSGISPPVFLFAARAPIMAAFFAQ
ncbi:hypothetical protein FHJ31_04070 [Pseudomonas sp. Fig-3]|nr:hypothetical protein FHJ31_04070 [Pseudomonas sp. Fig-3]